MYGAHYFRTNRAANIHRMEQIIQSARKALHENDAALLRDLLARHPEIKSKVNEPFPGDCGALAITSVRRRAMLDVLLDAGADLNAKTHWWAGGFGLLHCAPPEVALYAIERGAIVDEHAAARLGLIDKLRELISADPTLVHARGGDGQTPLHFASSIEIAKYLLDHCADIDARDVDHESTPAQYMVKERQEICRYLVGRGCKTDILMAAALGDERLARQHLDADPECIRTRVTDEYFPMVGGKSGGTIYQWTLGWYVSAPEVAKQFGHENLFQELMHRSPANAKLVTAAWLGDEQLVDSLLHTDAALVSKLSPADERQIAHAARNNNFAAVRLMLCAGWPINACGQHGATPLHWAAWHGNVEMVRLILRHNPPLEPLDRDFRSTPLGWAIHGSDNGWCREKGHYVTTVEELLKAGAKLPQKLGGTDAVKKVFRRHGLS
jgi:ankyrin repeat protein